MWTAERIEALQDSIAALVTEKEALRKHLDDMNATLQHSEEELAYALNEINDLRDEIITWHLHHDDCYRPYEVEEYKQRIRELEDDLYF